MNFSATDFFLSAVKQSLNEFAGIFPRPMGLIMLKHRLFTCILYLCLLKVSHKNPIFFTTQDSVSTFRFQVMGLPSNLSGFSNT